MGGKPLVSNYTFGVRGGLWNVSLRKGWARYGGGS